MKENTTLGCHESFLSKNRTMTIGEDHPQLEMMVDRLLVDELYLWIAMVGMKRVTLFKHKKL